MATILVLGSTGTVGSPLTSILAASGHDVRAATRSPEDYTGSGEAVALDVTDPSTWGDALEGVERIFVLAPPGHANQYELLRPFLEQAFETGNLDRVVTMTAQGVDSSDEIPFRQLELFIEENEIPFVHLRPSWFSQNFHTFWGHGVRAFDTIALPAEDARVAFIDARDIASSAAGALTSDVELNRAYELTGPEALTHAEAAEVLSEAVGRKITYQPISDDEFREQLAPSGLPEEYIELLVGLFQGVRAGAAANVTDHVKRLSGEPARPLSVYAADYREALEG